MFLAVPMTLIQIIRRKEILMKTLINKKQVKQFVKDDLKKRISKDALNTLNTRVMMVLKSAAYCSGSKRTIQSRDFIARLTITGK